MSPRALAVLIGAAVLAATSATVSARPSRAAGYFSAPSAYRVASVSYTSSAIRVDHDQDTGDLSFVDAQSSKVTLHAGVRATLGAATIDAAITGATKGTMTRYYQGNTVGSCTYTIPINAKDRLLIELRRHGTGVSVAFIDSINRAGYCANSGGDAEAFNWYLPDKTYPVSAFSGNTVILGDSGTHTDYPHSSSYNTWKWDLTVTLRRVH